MVVSVIFSCRICGDMIVVLSGCIEVFTGVPLVFSCSVGQSMENCTVLGVRVGSVVAIVTSLSGFVVPMASATYDNCVGGTWSRLRVGKYVCSVNKNATGDISRFVDNKGVDKSGSEQRVVC